MTNYISVKNDKQDAPEKITEPVKQQTTLTVEETSDLDFDDIPF